jgi:hypothetical protein
VLVLVLVLLLREEMLEAAVHGGCEGDRGFCGRLKIS